ncbi:hypothetical protein F5Y00DRAFT_271154 [Daldinia vernicosa]|uniref:uncharacterized protein n=1 Tax=Daldinia vernicosa TaxID=114800 RepID=UPI002008E0E0|nr:uncharacterized protein F5Y00DRAFT_271154 [Daldinia vernicosa]KAI0847414.1 hypothetical protein F5Y00DRAFT_271154 [Daldinia vernicosa]
MPLFADPAIFPSFNELPSSSTPPAPTADWFLLAQIKEDMTITKPTAIVRDRSGAEFAVTFEDGDHRGLGQGGVRFRKGHTLVVPRATRTDRGEGKKPIVRVPPGEGAGVKILPAGLEQVFEIGAVLDGIEGAGRGKRCAACGKEQEEEEEEGAEHLLMRCTGCGVVAYCSKACQVQGWSELGHKANCKVIRSIKEIWS